MRRTSAPALSSTALTRGLVLLRDTDLPLFAYGTMLGLDVLEIVLGRLVERSGDVAARAQWEVMMADMAKRAEPVARR